VPRKFARALRQQGLTIDEIAAATGYPRSSVGCYVRKRCGDKVLARRGLSAVPSVEPEAPKIVVVGASESKRDRFEVYLEKIEKEGGPSLLEILDGKKRGGDALTGYLVEEKVLKMLKDDPQTLHLRLNLIKELIRMAPFLHIDPDRIRKLIINTSADILS